jgi:hypothetical protein
MVVQVSCTESLRRPLLYPRAQEGEEALFPLQRAERNPINSERLVDLIRLLPAKRITPDETDRVAQQHAERRGRHGAEPACGTMNSGWSGTTLS